MKTAMLHGLRVTVLQDAPGFDRAQVQTEFGMIGWVRHSMLSDFRTEED